MLDEQILWEGFSQNLAAKATAGHVAEHYTLTSEYLTVERGLLRTEAHQIRLEDIADVDLKQSLTQKAAGKGDIIIRVARQGHHDEQTLTWVAEPKKVRDLIGDTIRQARERHLETTRYVAQPVAPATPPAAQSPAEDHVMATLERLARLHEAGAVTDSEFETKKRELLSQL